MTDSQTIARSLSDAQLDKIADAIEAAECPHHEGPFGGYDYGHNEAFYGPAPKGGRYVIRDFRDPSSPNWGAWVHQAHDREAHERAFTSLTRRHIALAAFSAVCEHLMKGEG